MYPSQALHYDTRDVSDIYMSGSETLFYSYETCGDLCPMFNVTSEVHPQRLRVAIRSKTDAPFIIPATDVPAKYTATHCSLNNYYGALISIWLDMCV